MYYSTISSQREASEGPGKVSRDPFNTKSERNQKLDLKPQGRDFNSLTQSFSTLSHCWEKIRDSRKLNFFTTEREIGALVVLDLEIRYIFQ